MEIVQNAEELKIYFDLHQAFISEETTCLMDQFLDRALEVDVDLVRGPDWTVIGGVIEHIEAAGVHSGDSMGVVPPQRLKKETSLKMEDLSRQLADRLGILGFLNLQLAVKDDEVFMLEANPRSSRSVPFIAKATGVPLVDLGVKAMLGLEAAEVKPEQYDWRNFEGVSVKGVVFPFKKFPDSDSILGPEMKSTGETMGRGRDYPEALLKAVVGCDLQLPDRRRGVLFLARKGQIRTFTVDRKSSRNGLHPFRDSRAPPRFLKRTASSASRSKRCTRADPIASIAFALEMWPL